MPLFLLGEFLFNKVVGFIQSYWKKIYGGSNFAWKLTKCFKLKGYVFKKFLDFWPCWSIDMKLLWTFNVLCLLNSLPSFPHSLVIHLEFKSISSSKLFYTNTVLDTGINCIEVFQKRFLKHFDRFKGLVENSECWRILFDNCDDCGNSKEF